MSLTTPSISRTPLRNLRQLTLLAALCACLGSLSGCGNNGQAQAADAPAGPPPAPPVSVAAVVARSVMDHQEFSGRIEAVESAQIRARVGGVIEAVHFKPGSIVKKGDLLFTIDPRAYKAEVARSEAAAASAQAKAELAKTELERSKRLLADQAIAQRDFDTKAANARQLAADARADQAAVAVAKLNLDYASVRAPFSGRIGKAEVTAGNLVDSNVVLTSLVSLQPVYVSFDGDESTYLNLGPTARKGTGVIKVRMGLANESGFPHEGRLDFIDNSIDPASSSVRMRAVLDNKDGVLTPGLFARVQVGTPSANTQSILINEAAVGTDQNRKYVYVVGADNKAEYRVIELGQIVDGLRVARAGLKPGERIVINGLQRVRPGAPVTPQMVPMTGENEQADKTAAAPKTAAAQ